LDIYRRIEDWHGTPDPKYRGSGGPVFVEPAPDPNPLAPATIEAGASVGIPRYENPNGRMMDSRVNSSIRFSIRAVGKRAHEIVGPDVIESLRPHPTVAEFLPTVLSKLEPLA
jgi:choline dehydrogenase-like flavoprotein